MKKIIAFCFAIVAAVSAHAQAQVIYSNQNAQYAPPPYAAPVARPHIGQGYITPFALGVFYPAQLPPGTVSVHGLRLNLLYSEVADMNGLDIGALASVVNGNTRSLQIAPIIMNRCDGAGISIGAVEVTDNYYNGLQLGVVEYAGQMEGVQVGLWNGTENLHGLQIGLVNWARYGNGVQLGLVNIIENSELPFFPILNCHF